MPDRIENCSPVPSCRVSERNQPVECFKLVASFLVVFIHCPFPGRFGWYISCLARCAVPGFLAISGFFSYQVRGKQLLKRMRHIVVLLLAGCFAELFCHCLLTEFTGGSTIAYIRSMIPGISELAHWIVLNTSPFSDHLWYLSAVLECYLLLWIYTGFFSEDSVDYRPLYLGGICLMAMNLLMSVFSRAANVPSSTLLYRNALFLGVPMFAMGLFIRQYQQRIFRNYSLTFRNLLLLAAAGILLSFVEWNGLGMSDINIGTVIAVIAILLLLVEHPQLPRAGERTKKLVSRFGFWSTTIYILHPVVIDVYAACLKDWVVSILGEREPWAAPVIVALISLAAAILWEPVFSFVKRRLKKKS